MMNPTHFKAPSPCMTALSMLGASAALILGGCGPYEPPTYPVSGSVSWNGKPLPDGVINLFPEDGVKSKAYTGRIKEGKFELKATAGKKRVEIWANREKAGQANVVMGLRAHEQYLPAKYNGATVLRGGVGGR